MTTSAYPCDDAVEMPEGNYCRLCPCPNGDWGPHGDADLAAIAGEMKFDSPAKEASRAKAAHCFVTMPAGFTYFGQFIDHDITRDNREVADATPNVAETMNFRTARLDLDHLYGKDPASVACIYEPHSDRLMLSLTEAASGANGPISPTFDDLPRSPDGTARVIDPRSDENLILAQLHVLFTKLHNCALDLIDQQPSLSAGLASGSGTERFRKARRFVTWHYQWIVLNDFLPRFIRTAVLDDINRPGSSPRLFDKWYSVQATPVSLPVEFSVAAYRFGHSIVRRQYRLNKHVGGVDLEQVITMTKRGGGVATTLPANYVIEWPKFFLGTSGQMNRADFIDTFITDQLYNLPKQTEDAFRLQSAFQVKDFPPGPMIPPLPLMTLRRGSKMRLPSGQEFANYFGFTPISAADIPALPPDQSIFSDELSWRTPLWYYLLREAVVEPNVETPGPDGRRLQKLGTIGSRIVAETIYQLLYADGDSILNEGRGWQPPIFTVRPGDQAWCLNSMAQLTRFFDRTSSLFQANRDNFPARSPIVAHPEQDRREPQG